MLKDIEKQKNRKLTAVQKIYAIFAYRFKHFDTEEEEERKGVSLREIALVINHDENKITIEEMIKAETVPSKKVYLILKNTKATIKRFRKWRRELKESGNQDPDEDTGFNLHCMKTRKGKYYYFNLMNEKDLQKIELQDARTHMRMTKRLDKIRDILEMSPKERQEKERKFEEKLWEKRKKNMEKAKTWDGKPYYFDVDFTGVNLLDSLNNKSSNQKEGQEKEEDNNKK